MEFISKVYCRINLTSKIKISEWHLFFDGMVLIKSIDYFERYFATIDHISQTGYIPLCIYAIKCAFLLQMLDNAVFYFIPLSHNARVVLFDYAYLCNVGQDLALLGIFLFICPYLLIDQIYINAIKTDYIQVPYQLIIHGHGKRYFLRTSSNGKSRIVNMLKQRMVTYANYYAAFVLCICKCAKAIF